MEEPEITLLDLLNALQATWRSILAGALLLPITVAAGFHFLGKYSVEAVLSNTCISSPNDQRGEGLITCALTFTQWRMLSENLPAFASQWLEGLDVESPDRRSLGALSSAAGWEKHVVPVFALSQAETKKFPLMGEGLKSESTRISQIRVTRSDREKNEAIEALDKTVRFIRDCATYLDAKILLNGYGAENAMVQAHGAPERLATEVEAEYLKARLLSTEAIESRDDQSGVSEQVRVDMGTVATNYLPLRTQVNALKIRLYEQEEKLKRLTDQKLTSEILSAYLARAMPVLGPEFSGEAAEDLMARLLGIREEMAQGVPPEDRVRQAALERIGSDLVGIQGRYGLQLPELVRKVERQRAGLPVLLASSFGGALLGFLMAFGWTRIRETRSPPKRI